MAGSQPEGFIVKRFITERSFFQSAVPSLGCWIWNDETQSLEFNSLESKSEVKEKKKVRSSTYQEHFRKHLEKLQRNTARPTQLDAFKSSIMRSPNACVTIQDVKLAALCLLQEYESLPIPLPFLTLLKGKELEELMTNMLLYFSYFFEKKTLEEKPKSLLVEEIGSNGCICAGLKRKLAVAQKWLALSYSRLLMGEGLPRRKQTSLNRTKVSATRDDIQLYECLYSFCGYVVWVTFERRHLKVIQMEAGRLFRSNTFNPTLRSSDESEESSGMGPQSEFQYTLKRRRPALSHILKQRSPLIASLLPSPQEAASHLFEGFMVHKNSSSDGVAEDADIQELTQRLQELSFGILGKPLNQFSSRTLKPQNEEETEDEDDFREDITPKQVLRSSHFH